MEKTDNEQTGKRHVLIKQRGENVSPFREKSRD